MINQEIDITSHSHSAIILLAVHLGSRVYPMQTLSVQGFRLFRPDLHCSFPHPEYKQRVSQERLQKVMIQRRARYQSEESLIDFRCDPNLNEADVSQPIWVVMTDTDLENDYN